MRAEPGGRDRPDDPSLGFDDPDTRRLPRTPGYRRGVRGTHRSRASRHARQVLERRARRNGAFRWSAQPVAGDAVSLAHHRARVASLGIGSGGRGVGRPDGDSRGAAPVAPGVGRSVPPRVDSHDGREDNAAELSGIRRMNWPARLVAFVVLVAATRAGSQYPVHVEGPARARATLLVRRALAASHDVMITDSLQRLVLPRGTNAPRTLVILGGEASVGSSVHGDVIVVGGDLFLHPGASIDGHAIAIGGAVYGSTLASVKGGIENVRDETFDVTQTESAIWCTYRYIGGRDRRIELPVLDGFRISLYYLVYEASVPWGPILLPTIRLEVDPTVTYRSHIGEWDPGVRAVYELGKQYDLTVDVRRGTFTNDAWIYSDILNSFNALFTGKDVRNYYRADRGELEVRRFDE